MKYNPDIVCRYFVSLGLPEPVTEHRFHDVRKWRFDFAFPKHRVALEVEGGIWTGGRHSRGAGFKKDCEKYNTAASMGWRVLRVTPQDVCMLETVELIRETLHNEGNIYALIEQYRAEIDQLQKERDEKCQ